jgi:uncharacterized protein YndB with AHSA1/START domain
LSRNEIVIAAPPQRVFDVLSEPGHYADWVVGAADVRDADDEWPAVGSELHHSQGIGPFVLKDETRVLESEPPRRLVLHAEVEPLGTMLIALDLSGTPDGGTRVVMDEQPASGILAAPPDALVDRALSRRNVASLARLKELAESG